MQRLALGLALLPLLAATATAHGVRSEVLDATAVVVRLTYADGTPLADVSYEVRSPRDGLVYLSGRTDRYGRAAFVPDVPGTWALDARTDDGHGAHAVVPVDDALVAAAGPGPSRLARGLIGLGVVALITLILSTALRPRTR